MDIGREQVYKMRYKWLHRAGSLLLAGSLLFTMPGVARAAQIQAENGVEAQSETGETVQPDTETESKTETEGKTETEITSETEKDQLAALEKQPEAVVEESEISGKVSTENTEEIPLTSETEETEVVPGVEIVGYGTDASDTDNTANITGSGAADAVQEDHSDAAATYTSNIVAGNGVYLDELLENYKLSFAEGFSAVMDEIESNYKAFLEEPEDFLAENWQDVLAVYVMKYRQEHKKGKIVLSAACKDELERTFFMMNLRSNSAMLRKLEAERQYEEQETEGTVEIPGVEEWESERLDRRKEYYPLTAEDYMMLYGVSKAEKKLLNKYTSADCTQLCAVVTAAKGFVRAQAGTGVSEERIAIVTAACSLIGKVGYFWGGKSYAYGWDTRWGTPMTVSASGSRSSGTVRPFGLDCSGFVQWAYYNGLNGEDAGIGNHTSTQWDATEMVRIRRAQPGDLVFYRPGDAGSDNHVGIVIGVRDDGSLLVAHCSSGQNGVVAGEAWASGFKYVRTPVNLR